MKLCYATSRMRKFRPEKLSNFAKVTQQWYVIGEEPHFKPKQFD